MDNRQLLENIYETVSLLNENLRNGLFCKHKQEEDEMDDIRTSFNVDYLMNKFSKFQVYFKKFETEINYNITELQDRIGFPERKKRRADDICSDDLCSDDLCSDMTDVPSDASNADSSALTALNSETQSEELVDGTSQPFE